MSSPDAHDDLALLGVGLGPANLSVAALSERLGLRRRFFDARPEVDWHPGMLFDDSKITVSFLKDLVTFVDPTNPYSFLAFLKAERRLYRFVTAYKGRVSRREYDQYFRWVARRLEDVQLATGVTSIDLGGDRFVVRTDDGARYTTRHLSLGTGQQPVIPTFAQGHLGPDVYHAASVMSRPRDLTGKRVAVVGGGQSGAEVFLHLIRARDNPPSHVTWISSRHSFLPLDDSPFVNELFTPGYSNHFFGKDASWRRETLRQQKLFSDGIVLELLQSIYERLYEIRYLDGGEPPCRLLPNHEVVGIEELGSHRLVHARHADGDALKRLAVDVVILGTGYRYRMPACLEPLQSRLRWLEDGPEVDEHYAVRWDGPESLRLFALNATRSQRGVADPNLSLLAWRSAVVVNRFAGRPVYDLRGGDTAIDWADQE